MRKMHNKQQQYARKSQRVRAAEPHVRKNGRGTINQGKTDSSRKNEGRKHRIRNRMSRRPDTKRG